MATIVQCDCGAEYKRTETKFLVPHTGHASCKVCGATLESWLESTHVATFELVKRPDGKPGSGSVWLRQDDWLERQRRRRIFGKWTPICLRHWPMKNSSRCGTALRVWCTGQSQPNTKTDWSN